MLNQLPCNIIVIRTKYRFLNLPSTYPSVHLFSCVPSGLEFVLEKRVPVWKINFMVNLNILGTLHLLPPLLPPWLHTLPLTPSVFRSWFQLCSSHLSSYLLTCCNFFLEHYHLQSRPTIIGCPLLENKLWEGRGEPINGRKTINDIFTIVSLAPSPYIT